LKVIENLFKNKRRLSSMRMSHFFLPVMKENAADAQIISHQYMLRAGMIKQSTRGIYTWLPLGLRVLKKIENIVREEQNKAGAQEVLMPTIQPADLWHESGRYDDMGDEMLRIKDRHGRDMVYSPTCEELICDIFRKSIGSYKDLPKALYQIQWKFRDEIRPRFGVMRGREFYMKDCYSFDVDEDSAKKTYESMFRAYQNTFKRMGLSSVAVKADSGAIGGDLSHEFHILASTGESEIVYDKKLDSMDFSNITVDELSQYYAAADDLHNPNECPLKPGELSTKKGIEVGHVFYLGAKYTESMGITVHGPDGKPLTPLMGCYGIGISRLVAAVIEANHDEHGIIWPMAVAPYHVGIINLAPKNDDCVKAADGLYELLQKSGLDVLYDDRDARAGVKFSSMDLIGIPYHITVGPRGIQNGEYELKHRRSGEKENISYDQLVNFLQKIKQ
jgi:prolyl-tRNA synthetase